MAESDEIKDLIKSSPRITCRSMYQKRVFNAWKNKKNKHPAYDAIAFDTETTGLEFNQPSILHLKENTDIKLKDVEVFGISLCIPYREELVLVWARIDSSLFEDCCKLLSEAVGNKIAHNLRYDLRVLERAGCTVKPQTQCTLTMARIVMNRRMDFGLKTLGDYIAGYELGYDDELKSVLRNIKSRYTRAGYPQGYVNYSFLPDDMCGEYAMMDVLLTYLLHLNLYDDIRKGHKQVYRRERRVIDVVLKMEEHGMNFDRIRAIKEIARMEPLALRNIKELKRITFDEFNPNSHIHVKQALQVLGVNEKEMSKNGKLTSGKDILEKIRARTNSEKLQKFINILFELRSNNKLCGTYLKPLLRRAKNNKGIINCSINPTNTRTGRMAVSDPNLSNIPRVDTGAGEGNPVRGCIGPRIGFLWYLIDYSQMEMWLFSILSQEPSMLKVLLGGGDIHQMVYEQVDAIDKRQKAKAVNFGIIYGMAAKGMSESLSIPKLEAIQMIRGYHSNYKRIKLYQRELVKLLTTQGYIEDLFGKRYHLEACDGYKAINCIVQGCCAQILKAVLIEVDKYLETIEPIDGQKPEMVIPIHDEIIFEVPKKWPKQIELIWNIQEIMETILYTINMEIRLPTEASVTGTNWENKHSLWRQY